jgi:hypothetical protein
MFHRVGGSEPLGVAGVMRVEAVMWMGLERLGRVFSLREAVGARRRISRYVLTVRRCDISLGVIAERMGRTGG